jgi:hypothetical protein
VYGQGTAPTVAIDNTSGCQLYLSKGSLDASITTAKSSEVNVLVPGASDDADLVCICFIGVLCGLGLLEISIVCCKQSVTQGL